MRRLPAITCLALSLLLAGCDLLGIETLSMKTSKREAEGKAIGSACRHAGRAIEDCYTLNTKADKGAVFAGWREMNDYMRENKIEAVAPVLPPPSQAASAPPPPPPKAEAEDDGEHEEPDKPAKSAKSAKADKPAKGH